MNPKTTAKIGTVKTNNFTAKYFVERLSALRSPKELENVQRFFHDKGETKFLGLKMGQLFKLTKEAAAMPLKEVEKLLQNEFYEARMGAVGILDFKARDKKITPAGKKELFDLYMKHHDRINNWDMVDRSAPWVVGGYLIDKPRNSLYKLAKSKNVWERRTSIVSTWYFIRQGDLEDTFKIAEVLVNDKEETIHKAVGSWIREAGKRDKAQLLHFLDKHAPTMPRVMLRYALEKLDSKTKDHYMKLKKLKRA
jgi:3-methyladenine DNA glycosylase AlkD